MDAAETPPPPPWQRHPLFRFLASVRLAMLLLGVLIVAGIGGTVCESGFSAGVARHYIYEAPWFDGWLALLAVNLAASALARLPWRRHHTGFLVTHLGIILILAGALIGKTWGIEGTMTLVVGEPPDNRLVTGQRSLQITLASGDSAVAPADLIGRRPSPAKPFAVAAPPGDWRFAIIGQNDRLTLALDPEPDPAAATPAARLVVASPIMSASVERWLLAGDPGTESLALGPATIILESGQPPPATGTGGDRDAAAQQPPPPIPLEEGIFVFAKMPDQISRAMVGGLTGAKLRLVGSGSASPGVVEVEYGGATATFEVAAALGSSQPVPGTPFTLEIKNYWPDFRIANGQPGTASDRPDNPAAFAVLRGTASPVGTEGAVHAPDPGVTAASPTAPDRLTLYVAPDGTAHYRLASRQRGTSSGTMAPNAPLATGWADWTVAVVEAIPHAKMRLTARPSPREAAASPGTAADGRLVGGILVRATDGRDQREAWVAEEWPTMLPLASGRTATLSYGHRRVALPISLQLLDFAVERYEGSDRPAGFKSTLRITDPRRGTTAGQCWMNRPLNYPDRPLNTLTGLTYKISQASWDPRNLAQSSVQVLMDPGWGLKWLGSLLVASGIVLLYYVPGMRP